MKRMYQILVSLTMTVLLAGTPVAFAAASASASDMAAMKITFNEALAIANGAYPDLKLFSLSLDDENGAWVFQAELLDPADGSSVTVGIDSVTGEVLPLSGDEDNVNNENEDDGNRGNENDRNEQDMENGNVSDKETENDAEDAALLQNADLTILQAYTLVMNANTGAFITQIELQNENERPVYDAAFIDVGGQAQIVKIDATTGAILSEEQQSENE